MIIEEVELHKILGCESMFLKFNNKNQSSVYVVQNNNEPHAHHLLTMAVQLICSAKYSHSSFLKGPLFENIHEGTVRLKFILPLAPGRHSSDAINITIPMETESDNELLDYGPSTSKAAKRRIFEARKHGNKRARQQNSTNSENMVEHFLIINVTRNFSSNPDMVFYSINNGPKEHSSLAAFHGRFYICLDYMLPQLEQLVKDFNGGWLELLTSDLNEKWNRRAQFGDPFERFVQLYHKYGYPEQHILSKITSTQLSNMDAVEALHKTYIIKILRDTRGIFEFISAGEYTVWFYVPHYGRFADVVDAKVEDLNFEHMTTYIEDNSKSKNNKYFWTDVPTAIRDMLLIAFQISLGFHCKQQIIYLNNFEEISKYQAIQIAITAHFTKLGVGNKSWSSKNYLQRIIDVCIKSGSTAIIEYPGGTPLHPTNVNLMKSYKISEAGKTSLILKLINAENYSYEYFMECLLVGLNNLYDDNN